MLYHFSGSQSDIESETNFSVRNQKRRRSRVPAGIATTSGIVVASTSSSASQHQQHLQRNQRGSIKRPSVDRECGGRERIGSASGGGNERKSNRDNISEFQNIGSSGGTTNYGANSAAIGSHYSDNNIINKCNESYAGSCKMSNKSNSTHSSSTCSDSTCSDGETTSETTTSSGEPNLPYPGFTEISLKYLTQDTKPRNWCLKLITNPYPFSQ